MRILAALLAYADREGIEPTPETPEPAPADLVAWEAQRAQAAADRAARLAVERQAGTPARLGGRCRSGSDFSGRRVHFVPGMARSEASGFLGYRALCGAKPGRASYGWEPVDGAVTCPRCSKLKAQAGEPA